MTNLFPIIRNLLSGDYISAIAYVISAAVVVFLLLPVHEWAHAYSAYKMGDPTAKYMGRMTLNPMHHIDWLGAACIMLVGFGWAKPVPINARNFQNPKKGMALSALAGPVSNLVMAFAALLLMNLTARLGIISGVFSYRSGSLYYSTAAIGSAITMIVYSFFSFVATINISLAIFNLIPIPPLDGSRLLTALLPDRIYYKIMQYERYIMLALMLLLFAGVLSRPLSILSGWVYNGFNAVAGLIFGFKI